MITRTLIRGTVILTIALALMIGGALVVAPSLPRGDQIAYVVWQSNSSVNTSFDLRLRLYDITRAATIELTTVDSPLMSEPLRWSPDGAMLAYFGTDQTSGVSHLNVIDERGALVNELPATNLNRPIWHDDGFLFTEINMGGVGMRVNHVALSGEVTPDVYAVPSFSWALFPGDDVLPPTLAYHDPADSTRLVIETPETDERQAIDLAPDLSGPWRSATSPEPPRWSPDGRYVMVNIGTWEGSIDFADYAIYDRDGVRQHVIIDAMAPAWSPDSTRVAYTSVQGAPRTRTVTATVYDLRTDVHQSTIQGGSLRWSPDGRMLLSQYEGVWYVVDVASGDWFTPFDPGEGRLFDAAWRP